MRRCRSRTSAATRRPCRRWPTGCRIWSSTRAARDRENLTAASDQFLESTLDEQRRRLTEQEKKLADYRQAHRGELPSQQEANLQAVQNFQTQIRTLADRINDAQTRRLLIEKNIQELEGLAEQTSQMQADGRPGDQCRRPAGGRDGCGST